MVLLQSLVCTLAFLGAEPHSLAAPQVTSLTNPDIKYQPGKEHFAVLTRGGVTAIIADNAAFDIAEAPEHRAGYNGLVMLKHAERNENLFVPGIAGLNFEHIHDGTLAVDKERFEPRKAPMELRIINDHTVELYQPPTPNWMLESCGRYELLEDGVIEYTFECIPRKELFAGGFIGLFWASYIHEPEDRAIYFRGRKRGSDQGDQWIKAVTPRHGVDSTHPPAGVTLPEVHPEFSLTLVNHPSEYVYDEPWYFGVSHDMAYVQMFRDRDRIWFAQSPTGGGATNPAWDFQWFIPNYKVGQAYGFVMRTAYFPFMSREQVVKKTQRHREALERESR